MINIVDWIIDNWQRVGLILTLLILLSLSGSITRLLRGAKDGMKEVMNPIGFFIFLGLILLVLYLFDSFGDILP